MNQGVDRRGLLRALGGAAIVTLVPAVFSKVFAQEVIVDPVLGKRIEDISKALVSFFKRDDGGGAFLKSLPHAAQKEAFIRAIILGITAEYKRDTTRSFLRIVENKELLTRRTYEFLPEAYKEYNCPRPLSDEDMTAGAMALSKFSDEISRMRTV